MKVTVEWKMLGQGKNVKVSAELEADNDNHVGHLAHKVYQDIEEVMAPLLPVSRPAAPSAPSGGGSRYGGGQSSGGARPSQSLPKPPEGQMWITADRDNTVCCICGIPLKSGWKVIYDKVNKNYRCKNCLGKSPQAAQEEPPF